AIGGKQTCRGDLERSYWEDGDGAQRRTWNECWQGAFSVGTISRWLRVLNCWSAEVKQRHTVGGSAASKAHSQVGSLSPGQRAGRNAIVRAGKRQENAMSIIRLIHIKIDPSETETAERIWKTECATLMIAQKGCISEKLLRAREHGEFISYSEWETEADIERYLSSAAHKQIVSHTRSVKGASAVVKLYDLVN